MFSLAATSPAIARGLEPMAALDGLARPSFERTQFAFFFLHVPIFFLVTSITYRVCSVLLPPTFHGRSHLVHVKSVMLKKLTPII